MTRQRIALAYFVVGLFAGGLCSGMVLWLLSGLTQPIGAPWRYGAALAVAALAVLRDLGVVRIRLPQNARQVPQHVLRSHLVRGALQFGFELGTGVRTYVSASAPYALAVGLLMCGQSFWVAAVAGLGFGAGRAATPLLRYAARTGEQWDDAMQRRIRAITVLCSASFTVLLGVILLR